MVGDLPFDITNCSLFYIQGNNNGKNHFILKDYPLNMDHICESILALYQFEYDGESTRLSPHRSTLEAPIISFLTGYFDGAAQGDRCVCGVVIKMSPSYQFHFHWNSGWGMNNRENFIFVWGLLYCTKKLGIDTLHILGDSHVVIEWLNGHSYFNLPFLFNQIRRIARLKSMFKHTICVHVYMELNFVADTLPTRGLTDLLGSIVFSFL